MSEKKNIDEIIEDVIEGIREDYGDEGVRKLNEALKNDEKIQKVEETIDEAVRKVFDDLRE